MMLPGGELRDLEVAALERHGMTVQDLETFSAKARDPLSGERRALRVPISHVDVEGGMDEHGNYVKCVFELPRGSFATTVMREVMKPPAANPVEAEVEE